MFPNNAGIYFDCIFQDIMSILITLSYITLHKQVHNDLFNHNNIRWPFTAANFVIPVMIYQGKLRLSWQKYLLCNVAMFHGNQILFILCI